MAGRLTQLPAEILVTPENQKSRVTQLPAEIIVKPSNPTLRASQLPLEVLYTLNIVGNTRLSQFPVEVMLGNLVISTRKKYGPALQCV